MDFIKELENTKNNMANYGAECPEGAGGFMAMKDAMMAEGELSFKQKELIALSIGIVRQCADCIAFHIQASIEAGATKKEVAETVSVAIMMGGGPAFMYGARAMEAYDQFMAAKG